MSYSIQILSREQNSLIAERERIHDSLIDGLHSQETEHATNVLNKRIDEIKIQKNVLLNEPLKNY